MIFFRGAGILVLLVFIVFIPLSSGINLLLGANYYEAHSWPKGLCCLVAGAIVWGCGKNLNRAAKENEFAPTHTFMFIKMEYWGFVYAAVGVLLLINL